MKIITSPQKLLLLTATTSSCFLSSSSFTAPSAFKLNQIHSYQHQQHQPLTSSTTSLLASPQSENDNNDPTSDFISKLGKGITSTLLALTLSFNSLNPASVMNTIEPANAADGAAIGTCLLKKCRLPLAKCIVNPNCLANVICINTCNGKEDETGCQIKCGDIFENSVVGEFNKCAVSDMDCVPTRPDDGSYPIPANENMVSSFDTKLWNGRWYITAGQNELFDRFPCQVHFFTETEPGKFFGKLNWRIQEPDGEFFTRDAVQRFVQDPKQPAHLINHDNEYLHYEDDWYIIDYAEDDNKEGVPPFAFVYYRGANDAWVGYGGAVVYTRDSKLPEELIPRLREAAKKVNFDYDKDFATNDNTCTELAKGENVLLREKFVGKMALQTEEQLQAATVRARNNAVNGVKAQVLFANDELGQATKAIETLEKKAVEFEKEIVKDVVAVEQEIVKDVVAVEKEIVKDVVAVEKEIVKDVVNVEKEIVKDVVGVEKEIVGKFNKK
jgi:violaxanthin de-epoxidase